MINTIFKGLGAVRGKIPVGGSPRKGMLGMAGRTAKLFGYVGRNVARFSWFSAKDLARDAVNMKPLAVGTIMASAAHIGASTGSAIMHGGLSPIHAGATVAGLVASKWAYEAVKYRKGIKAIFKAAKHYPMQALSAVSNVTRATFSQSRSYIAGRTSVLSYMIDGLPKGGAASASRKANTAAATGIGVDAGHNSPWGGILHRILRFFGIGKSVNHIAGAANDMRSILRQRESLVKELAPTEFLRSLDYKVRTPAGGDVTVTAGRSKVTFARVDGKLLAESVETVEQHKRQGLASYFYRVAEEATGMPISRSATRTKAGTAFFDKRKYKNLKLRQIRPNSIAENSKGGVNMVKRDTTHRTIPGIGMSSQVDGSRVMSKGTT